MLNMSTFFKVQMGQNRVITGVSAVDPTVRVGKRLISVKTIGFYIVSPVGKVIIKLYQFRCFYIKDSFPEMIIMCIDPVACFSQNVTVICTGKRNHCRTATTKKRSNPRNILSPLAGMEGKEN